MIFRESGKILDRRAGVWRMEKGRGASKPRRLPGSLKVKGRVHIPLSFQTGIPGLIPWNEFFYKFKGKRQKTD